MNTQAIEEAMVTISLTRELAIKLQDVLASTQDEGPSPEGWQSDELMELREIVDTSMRQESAAGLSPPPETARADRSLYETDPSWPQRLGPIQLGHVWHVVSPDGTSRFEAVDDPSAPSSSEPSASE